LKGQILIISGPSGSGKSTLLSRLLKEENDLYFSISSTTRAPRQGETEGVNYYFTSEDEFKKGIESPLSLLVNIFDLFHRLNNGDKIICYKGSSSYEASVYIRISKKRSRILGITAATI